MKHRDFLFALLVVACCMQGCNAKTPIKTGGPFYYETFALKTDKPLHEITQDIALKKPTHYVAFFGNQGELVKLTKFAGSIVQWESVYRYGESGKLLSRKTTSFLPQGPSVVEHEFKDEKSQPSSPK